MDQLPNESIHYIGDTLHGPYGPRPIAEVRQFSQNIADELVERGCKMIVIACNTATAAFLHDARERYDVPVVEVIRPAVRRAMATTRNGKVGVIGTQGTVNSGAYQDLFAVNPGIQAFATACPDFVPFVERGITSGRQILGVAENYLAPLQAEGVDTLVLGCTHYPLLSGVIQLAMGDNVTLVSSAEKPRRTCSRCSRSPICCARTPSHPPASSSPLVHRSSLISSPCASSAAAPVNSTTFRDNPEVSRNRVTIA